MASKVEHFAPRALIAIGCWLLLAALVVSCSNPENLVLSGSTRIRGVHQFGIQQRSPTVLRSAPEDPENVEQAVSQGWEMAVGAAAIGMAAAQAESEQLIPFPWAATGLSLAFLAVVLYLFNEWRRPGPGFALAGPSMPDYTSNDELDLAEMAAKPMAMSTSGSGKVAGEILITVDKPLGLTLGQKKSGGIEVSFVNPLGNAAKSGLKPGDTVVYHSSFFGDELWPADKLSYVRSAISACPNAVDFIILRGAAAEEVNVKRLPKRPAPPKIGRKLTAAQKTRATHICLDCGWIYALPTTFDEQPKDYRCPQCQATKSRFAKYDVESGKISGGGGLPQGILAGVLGGAALVAVLGYIALAL